MINRVILAKIWGVGGKVGGGGGWFFIMIWIIDAVLGDPPTEFTITLLFRHAVVTYFGRTRFVGLSGSRGKERTAPDLGIVMMMVVVVVEECMGSSSRISWFFTVTLGFFFLMGLDC